MKLPTEKLQAWLAGVWAGASVAVGAVGAPALFAVLPKQMAGQGAGQMFAIEARISLVMAVLLFLFERKRVRDQADVGQETTAMSTELLLVLGALFLTVAGQFALHPMIEAAKLGQPTPLSFGALHGISAGLYWLKLVALLVLSWRLMGRLTQAKP